MNGAAAAVVVVVAAAVAFGFVAFLAKAPEVETARIARPTRIIFFMLCSLDLEKNASGVEHKARITARWAVAPPGLATAGSKYYLRAMPSKHIELPPGVAQAFVRDMRAFFKAKNQLKQDEIASRQLHALGPFSVRGKEAAARGRERDVPADEGSRLKQLTARSFAI